MEPINSFGYWLRRRRKALDLTQDELARQVGCAIGTLKKIETDERRPSKQLAERLADCLALPTPERAAFLKAARAELAVDGLAVAVQPPDRPQDAPRSPSLPSGTVTFLFTDIEGSTQLWEQHPQMMPAALARHDAILRQAVAAHGGSVFKTVGDSIHAVFSRAADALTAALTAQRALCAETWAISAPLRVRMALHTGAAEIRDGNYFGPPLNRIAGILALGHGGQILLSHATHDLIADDLLPQTALHGLGEQYLRDLSRPEQIYQLISADLPSDFPPLRTLDIRRHNLPTQPTALIGREQEVARVLQLLQQPAVRLVTLTGPGGIGKTRLALQVAVELLDAFPNGVWFVNLAPISDVGLVAATIAQALGMLEAGAQPLIARLQSYLRAKQLLLLLDNFEQVVAAAPDIAALLAAAPGLSVLVTSRTMLHLAGEHELVVPPLAVPEQAHLPAADQLSDYAAVRLFIDRAQAARADFQVTTANAPAVAAICAQLDGLPLAIELAAVRVKLFAPPALLARLSNRLTFLSGGARDLPARQRTLRDTIAWSYDLLDAGEKTLFARLGVFVGGCTLEAAEAVCNTNGGLPISVVDDVAALVDKSLLRHTEGPNGEPRFTMLETVGEYALEQLVSGGAAPTAHQQHAAYYLALAERAEPELRGPAQRAWLDQLELEIDNLRAALQWALAQGLIDSVARMGVALARFWEWRDHLQEGIRWLEAALQQEDALEVPLRARALRVVARLYIRQSGLPELDKAERYLRESLALFETLGDQRELARVRADLGWLLVRGRGDWGRGDWAQATPLLEASLALGRALGEPGICAWALDGLGMVALMHGDWAAARASYTESLALRRMLGDQAGIAWGFAQFGALALAQGEYTEAHTRYTQRLRIEQALDHKQGIASSLAYLGEVATIQRQLDAAAAYLAASLELARDIGDTSNIVYTLGRLSILAMERGDLAGAQACIEESLALSRELSGDSEGAAYILIVRGDVALLRGDVVVARASYEESHAGYQEVGSPGMPLLRLGMLAQQHGDAVQATALLGESLRLVYAQKDPVLMALDLAGLASICPVPERAARLAGAAAAMLESVRGYERLWPIDRTSYDRTLQSVRDRLEPPVLARAWAAGQAMTLEQAIAEAVDDAAEAPIT